MSVVTLFPFPGGGGGATTMSSSLITLPATQSVGTSFAQVSLDAESYASGWLDGNDAVVPSGVTLVRPTLNVNGDNSGNIFVEARKDGASYHGLPYASTNSGGSISVNAMGAFVAVTAGDAVGLYAYRSAAPTSNLTDESDRRSWLQVEKIDPATNYCLAQKGSSQSISSSTNTPIQWNGADVVDTIGFHDPTTNNTRFTIPSGTTGLVRITANCAANATSSTGAILSISKNGGDAGDNAGEPIRDCQHSGAPFLNVATAILEVTAGDYFEVIFRSGGSSVSIVAADYVWAQIEEVQPSSRALAYRTGTLSLSAGVATTVPLQATEYDNDSWYDGSKFVVPAGVDYIRAAFAIEGASQSDDLQGGIEINGAPVDGCPYYDNDTTGVDFVSGISGIIPVSEGDEITLVAYSTSARSLTTRTWMSVEEVVVSSL